MKQVLQITLGILLAGLITLLVRIGYYSYIEYQVKQELEQISQQQQQLKAAQLQAQKDRYVAQFKAQKRAAELAAEKSRLAKQNEAARLRKAEA